MKFKRLFLLLVATTLMVGCANIDNSSQSHGQSSKTSSALNHRVLIAVQHVLLVLSIAVAKRKALLQLDQCQAVILFHQRMLLKVRLLLLIQLRAKI